MRRPLPTDWIELEGLLGAAETSRLDFKKTLPVNPKLARSLAAMSIAGGTVIFGIDQDEKTGLATELSPIAAVTDAEERIGQVMANTIKPPLKAAISVIHDPADRSRGAIVVRVPVSEVGPHEVAGRFPTRSGTTTRDLSPAEVAAIFRERDEARSRPTDLLDDAAFLPGIPEVRVRSLFAGFGQLRVAARPRDASAEHPESPWLADALASSVARARARAEERLAIYAPSFLLARLGRWSAQGGAAWVAGGAGQDPECLARDPTVAAVLTYPWRTLVQVTVPTWVGGSNHMPPYTCAHEGRIAAELWGALAFFAELYGAASPQHIDLAVHLAGFTGAVSYHASHAWAGLDAGHLRKADDGIIKLVSIDSEELFESPEDVARRLIERWLVGFYEGRELLSEVTVPRQAATRLR